MVILILLSLTFILIGVLTIARHSEHSENDKKNVSFHERNYLKDKNDTDFIDFSGGMLGI